MTRPAARGLGLRGPRRRRPRRARSRCAARSSRSPPRRSRSSLATGLRAARTPALDVRFSLDDGRALEATEIDAVLDGRAPIAPSTGSSSCSSFPQASRSSTASTRVALRLRAGEERELPVPLRCTRWGVYELGAHRACARATVLRIVDLGAARRADGSASRPTRADRAARDRLARSRRRRSPGARSRASKGDGSSTPTSATSSPGDRVRSINWRARPVGRARSSSTSATPSGTRTSCSSSTASWTCAGRTGARSRTPCAPPPSLAARYLERRDRVGLVVVRRRPPLAPARHGADAALPADRDDARDRRRADVHVARRQPHPGAHPSSEGARPRH